MSFDKQVFSYHKHIEVKLWTPNVRLKIFTHIQLKKLCSSTTQHLFLKFSTKVKHTDNYASKSRMLPKLPQLKEPLKLRKTFH